MLLQKASVGEYWAFLQLWGARGRVVVQILQKSVMLGALLSEGPPQTESSYVRWPLSSEISAGFPSKALMGQ